MKSTHDTVVVSRRQALALGLGASTALAGGIVPASANPISGCGETPVWSHGIEGQRRADLGNGSYLNPVLSGDRPDPSILKDGEDYYATFTSFVYYPGVPIWHSRDLINWLPIGPALKQPLGSVFAIDLAKYDGRFFAYIPVLAMPEKGAPTGLPFKMYVIHAETMRGPWSDPIDMNIDGFIDPGHIVGEDGHRYLFLNDGHRVRISDDGLSKAGEVEKVYDGWPIPADWTVEGFSLEGPKLLRHDGWFYLFSGQGGTAGPPTSHMVIVARSRSINGPWENCPHNPIVHTASRKEPWWSRGHATPVQGPAGDWWLAYHGYENGFRSLGRQMLLDPMTWDDGWPRAHGGDLGKPLPKPIPTANGASGFVLSDDFTEAKLGSQFAFYAPEAGYADRVRLETGALTLAGQGTGPADSSPLAVITGDRTYEFTIDVDLGEATQAGLLLFYDDKLFCGLGLSENRLLHTYSLGQEQLLPPAGPAPARRMRMRVVNDFNTATFFYGLVDGPWTKVSSFDVEGYNHNMAGGFLSLRPAVFVAGQGRAVFRAMRYSGNAR